ncbi:Selenide, water dikinase [Candidatus Thermoflexus japonica]|uniref:Selenide, water dikinase n=1 Tax=Candidatus Thermoflexus japonica TaxID=2035417 RepID=A0A2H5Y7H0_9CHLR|nr:Selenide, water dikinase [Candidatus Thermoflexus japonica]
MAPEALAHVLRRLHEEIPPLPHPAALIGIEAPDDAAVYQLDEETALVQSTDFFPPVVDDPYAYGAIAAANAMSDIYAMGGEVRFALNLVAFPDGLDLEILVRILKGAADKVAEAGGVVLGGHTVTDREPKFGLVVTGVVHPQRILRKSGARPGDVLVLTKPLGSGVITTALKRDLARPEEVEEAMAWMMRLNQTAARLAVKCNAHAATDVTGFGLLGHAWEMVEASGVGLTLEVHRLPWMQGARRCAEAGAFAGGLWRNREFYRPHVRLEPSIDEITEALLYDPQTSGGLLLAFAPADAEAFCARMAEAGESAWEIGRFEGEAEIYVRE